VNSFASATASQLPRARSVQQIMTMTLLALVPAIAVNIVFSGIGVAIQIALALAFALAFETAMLKLRAQPAIPFLTDFSAPLTAALFALLIPSSAPWWVAAVGMGAAIVVAKHLYGGLGHNLFNPAMVGLVAARIFFPQEFDLPNPFPGPTSVSDFGGGGNEWLALAYALGGIFLLWKKIIPWQTPLATLGAAMLLSLSYLLVDPNNHSMLSQAMFPAVWLLGAFFIVTDPVTGCVSARGRLIFGAGVGALGALIGHWRGDAAGLAFAILLMNCFAPWIDRLTWAKVRRNAPARRGPNA
jgi:electron transport complex protein RnfD